MHQDPAQLHWLFIFVLGISLSFLSGMVGPFVLATRTSSLLGTVSHAILAGVGLAVYFDWNQFVCILVVGVLIGLLIGVITLKEPDNKEMIMSATWSIAMALGVILLYQKGYDGEEIMHVLFGDIEHLHKNDILILCIGALAVVGLILFYFKTFSGIVLDFSIPLSSTHHLVYLLLLGVISFTAVLMVKFVGIILVLSLLSLPAAMALHFTKNIKWQMAYGVGLALVMTFVGLGLSFLLHLPVGATIALFSGLCYLPFLLLGKHRDKFSS